MSRGSPRDAQRRRLYLAETPLPTSPLPGLDACAAYADRVVGTLWWEARFPDRGLGRVPGFRPGHGARQAFFTTDERGTTITLPRRYRTKGVVLHELVALGPRRRRRPADPRPHLRPSPPRRHPGVPRRRARRGAADVVPGAAGAHRPSRRGSGPTAGCTTAGTSGCASGRARPWPCCTRRVTAVRSRPRACTRATSAGASTLRVRVGGAARPMRISAATVWDVRPMPEARSPR